MEYMVHNTVGAAMSGQPPQRLAAWVDVHDHGGTGQRVTGALEIAGRGVAIPVAHPLFLERLLRTPKAQRIRPPIFHQEHRGR